MIDAGYVRVMARYNAWQNKQLMPVLQSMTLSELTQDRGAFFGSILGTASHLLWGDMMWMSRFDPSNSPPSVPGTQSADMVPTAAAWAADRFRLDGKIRIWAERLKSVDIQGDLEWFSGITQKTQSAPMGVTITHMFNHQTHHRGQIHAMLTAAGQTAPVTDLVYLPEDD